MGAKCFRLLTFVGLVSGLRVKATLLDVLNRDEDGL